MGEPQFVGLIWKYEVYYSVRPLSNVMVAMWLVYVEEADLVLGP